MAARQGSDRGGVRREGPVTVADLSLEVTPIPGLVVLRLDVREDSRGWFKENWQREKMTALGLPDFGPVQHNVSFNTARGATRGIHTEPWDKFVSILTGRVFGAWVDMREGPTFGTVFTVEMDPHTAVFVPRGVGNSYQTLEDATTYSYLVNEHWRPGTAYPALNLADDTAAIPWPIPLAEAEISDKDKTTPAMADVVPMKPLKTLIVGALGQLGRALQQDFPDARPRRHGRRPEGSTVQVLDVSDPVQLAAFPWHEYALVLNAAAYTAVDKAETDGGPGARLGGERLRARGAGADRRRAPADARALLHRLRLRRHRRAAHRGRALLPAGRLRADQGRRRHRRRHGAAALHRAHLVGDRRRPQLRAHHAEAGRRRRLPDGRARPGRPADLHPRAVAGDQAPRRRRRAVRRLQRAGLRPRDLVGRPGQGGVPAQRARRRRRHAGDDGGVRRRARRASHRGPRTACWTSRRSRRPGSPRRTPSTSCGTTAARSRRRGG